MRIFCVFFILYPALLPANSAYLQSGLKQYQEGQYEQAKDSFQSLLQASPNHPALLFNLGLTQYQLGHHGLAIGLWRKTLEQDPSFLKAQKAIDFVQSQLPAQQPSHQRSWNNYLRTNLLVYTSWDVCLFLFALFGFVFLWLQIKHLADRRFLETKKNSPPLPAPVILIISGVIFGLVVLLMGFKINDHLTSRATIVSFEVDAKAGPNEDMASLFHLSEGLDVAIQQIHGDWVQVRSQEGQTGWIPKKDLFHYAGKKPW